jgi:hypothetical protein
MSTRGQDRTIVGVLEVSCSSRCFFGFVRKPSAFVMSFDCLLLSDVVRSFACLLSSVYKDRKVLALYLSLCSRQSTLFSSLNRTHAWARLVVLGRVNHDSASGMMIPQIVGTASQTPLNNDLIGG